MGKKRYWEMIGTTAVGIGGLVGGGVWWWMVGGGGVNMVVVYWAVK